MNEPHVYGTWGKVGSNLNKPGKSLTRAVVFNLWPQQQQLSITDLHALPAMHLLVSLSRIKNVGNFRGLFFWFWCDIVEILVWMRERERERERELRGWGSTKVRGWWNTGVGDGELLLLRSRVEHYNTS